MADAPTFSMLSRHIFALAEEVCRAAQVTVLWDEARVAQRGPCDGGGFGMTGDREVVEVFGDVAATMGLALEGVIVVVAARHVRASRLELRFVAADDFGEPREPVRDHVAG